jgi:hypothetical protein
MRRIALVIIALAAIAPGAALACACCTDPGQRHVGSQAIDAYAQGVFDELKFAEEASLYTGNAEAHDIKPISARSDRFKLAVARDGAAWAFTFKDDAGAESTLTFVTPAKVAIFAIDPRDETSPPPNGPSLYKEWKISAKAKGQGMFGAARHPITTLIIHGRGNSCTDATQFTAWTLVVESGGAAATFFGALLP